MTSVAFRRAAALAAIGSQLCLAGNLATWFIAADHDLRRVMGTFAFVDRVNRIALLKASLALDVGAYVLLVPLIAYLWTHFEHAQPARSRMYAAGGLAYSLAGATGAAVLFAAWPPLIRAYAAAGLADRAVIRPIFEAFSLIVTRGLWNVVAAAGIGVWLLGNGALLRPTHRTVGTVGAVGGVLALADAALVLAGANTASHVALFGLAVLGSLWVLLVAAILLGEPSAVVTTPGRVTGTHQS